MNDPMLQAWKTQVDANLRVVEAMIEGATRMHEAQLEAAAHAHADALATHKAIAGAKDAAELMRLQSDWARANLEKSVAYWRELYEAAMETNVKLARCIGAGERPAP